jgi:uncharacterized membrane protein YeaQ/YmgE (transglycosylase-associated protein family)
VPAPTLTFAFILATVLGALFHLIMGGDARRLALFLLAGWIGFGLGHLIGAALGINLFNVGTLRLVSATLGAIIALVAAAFFTSSRKRKRVRQRVL